MCKSLLCRAKVVEQRPGSNFWTGAWKDKPACQPGVAMPTCRIYCGSLGGWSSWKVGRNRTINKPRTLFQIHYSPLCIYYFGTSGSQGLLLAVLENCSTGDQTQISCMQSHCIFLLAFKSPCSRTLRLINAKSKDLNTICHKECLWMFVLSRDQLSECWWTPLVRDRKHFQCFPGSSWCRAEVYIWGQ